MKNQPTDWCSGMVIVSKSKGRVRICVDLSKLNESVKRVLPSVEHTLAQLQGASVFSKLDADSGFWQAPLSLTLLTTFITPFGRFCYNRLPLGITSAPELFQKRMSETLNGLQGTLLGDDILVFGKTQAEHDRHRKALEKIQQVGLTLNQEKCIFSTNTVKFLGHVVDPSGIRSDPDKINAVKEMPELSTPTEVRRFLGIVNQLGKFLPRLAEKTKPLRALITSSRS